MERFYQTEWLGIRFSDFAIPSAKVLAGEDFYNAFYRELFKRYDGYEKLDEAWKTKKKELADWIAAQLQPGMKVMSFGCGLGYVEYCLNRDHGTKFEIYVSDSALNSLKWLGKEFPEERIKLAGELGVKQEKYFDLIYLSAVDYALNNNELIEILRKQCAFLRPSGSCLMVSASYLEESLSLFGKIKTFGIKIIKKILQKIGLYQIERGQFWGWKRTRSEYRELMQTAGYTKYEDGFFNTKNQHVYFIRGYI